MCTMFEKSIHEISYACTGRRAKQIEICALGVSIMYTPEVYTGYF